MSGNLEVRKLIKILRNWINYICVHLYSEYLRSGTAKVAEMNINCRSVTALQGKPSSVAPISKLADYSDNQY